MFIKSVKIEGFKSYKNAATVGPFHNGFNIVLGRNGSGKSNFFSAVEFVLSDEYSHLKADQRNLLLSSSGGGARPISAFVEILFDNHEKRFPINEDEFSLRRTIGTKKDAYHLNGKPVQRKQLNGMMESAGFSHSNPYHIVKQGLISDLATLTGQGRLKIVHSLAGTKVYVDKKSESLAELDRSDKTIEDIKESLKMIADRQGILEEEKEDFLKFQKLDARRRTLEYLILERDLDESRTKANAADQEYKDSRDEFGESEKKLVEMKEELAKLKTERRQKKTYIQSLAEEINSEREHQEKMLKIKTGLELRLADMEKEVISQSNLSQDPDEILEDLIKKRTDLEKRLKEAVGQTEERRQALEVLEHERKELIQRSSRPTFASVSQRNNWIKGRISGLSGEIEQGLIGLKDKEDEYKANEASLEDAESKIQQMEEDIKALTSHLEEIIQSLKSCTGKKTQESQLISEKSQDLLRLQTSREKLYEHYEKANSLCRSRKGMRDILTGSDSVHELVAEDPRFGEGYRGILFDMFSTQEDSLTTVLDQTVGLRAFYHVVDSGKTATKLIKELNRRRMPGVFNFIPIDKIIPQSYVGEVDSNLGFPLMEKLDFEPENEAIIRSVFGKTLVCRDMEAVVALAPRHQAHCVTVDGEKGTSNGVLSGGYMNPRNLNFCRYKMMIDELEKLNTCTESLKYVETELDSLRAGHNENLKHLEKNKIQKERTERNIEIERNQLKAAKSEREHIFSKSIQLQKSLDNEKTSVKLLESSKASLELELEEDFDSQLSEEFSDKVKMLQEERVSFKKLVKAQQKMEADLNSVSSKIEVTQKSLDTMLEKASKETDRELKKQEVESELQLISAQLSECSENLDANLGREAEEKALLGNLIVKLDATEQSYSSLSDVVNSGKDKLESLLKGKSHYLERLNKTNEKLKNVEAFDSILAGKYSEESRKTLSKLFKKVQKDLKEFENVNKKALEQFEAFSVKEVLDERLEQLHKDREAILALIEDLDEKRSGQVAYTFKQVKKNFASIFKKIVPAGKGEVVLVLPEDVNELEKDDDVGILEAIGLEIEVSFTGI